jgi:hypothetical protein
MHLVQEILLLQVNVLKIKLNTFLHAQHAQQNWSRAYLDQYVRTHNQSENIAKHDENNHDNDNILNGKNNGEAYDDENSESFVCFILRPFPTVFQSYRRK